MSRDPRLPDLFAEASERQGEARERFLADLDSAAPEVAVEIRLLLARGAAGERRLSGTAWERFAAGEEPAERLPQRIGPYRILAEIGRGGMGRVYLAEEVREAFTRQLALKVIDRPWGASDRERRFRSEVRILASLEHPGIARFLEGGELPGGTLFLALEYVDGQDILTFANQRGLATDERVRLVVEVLGAVAYAHQQGIVHRDLKPPNILVDRFGRTRLLDFGVAKLLEEDGASAHPLTEPELRVFTPAYASPEQFSGKPVSVASDIYSAAVLLYELLTGSRPFGGAGSSRAELERDVLSSEPSPPSARLRATTESAARERRRGGADEPRQAPRPAIARDLDAICLQALRREPAERYVSAQAFADDLERYLAGEPVAAGKGTLVHAMRNAVRRHLRRGWRFAAIALLTAGVVAALAMRPGARSAAAPAAARPFPFSAGAMPPLAELVQGFDREPANVAAGAALAIALVREQRPEEAALIVTRLRQIPGAAEDPLVDYVEAALAAHRGLPQQALILFERALAGAQATGRGELVGQIRASYGRLLATLGRRVEARREMESAIAEFERAGDPASLARVLNDLAIELGQANDLDGAARLLERALVATRAASPTNSGATFIQNLGHLEMLRGRPDLAEVRFREIVAIFRDLDRPMKVSVSLHNLAHALWQQGRAVEARESLDQAIELGRSGPAASALDLAYFDRGCWDLEGGQIAEAVAAVEEIARLAGEIGTGEVAARGEHLRGLVARARGRSAEALERFGAARRLLSGAGAGEQVADLDLQEAELRAALGDFAQARALASATVAPLVGHGDRAALVLGEIQLARLDVQAGDRVGASRRLDRLAEVGEKSPAVELRIALWTARAELAVAEGRPDDARRHLETARRLAEEAGRKATALERRLDLAAVELAAGHRERALRASAAVEREAQAAGWIAIRGRARSLGR